MGYTGHFGDSFLHKHLKNFETAKPKGEFKEKKLFSFCNAVKRTIIML